MDSKPLLQERPPAYSPAAPAGAPGYDYGHGNYGAIPAPQPGYQPPPPYPYPGTAPAAGYAVPPPASQPNYSSTYTIIQQPATTTSVVVVGGCPACRSLFFMMEEDLQAVLLMKTHFSSRCKGSVCGGEDDRKSFLMCLCLVMGWRVGGHLHLSWCFVCHCILSNWDSVLPCTEAEKMP